MLTQCSSGWLALWAGFAWFSPTERGQVGSERCSDSVVPLSYVSRDGRIAVCGLNAVHDVIAGMSGKQKGWTATLVSDARAKALIELRSSPPDIRGNGPEEAEEVSDATFRPDH